MRQVFIIALQDLVDREVWRTPCRLEVKPSFQINVDAHPQPISIASHARRRSTLSKHARARQIMVRLEKRNRQEMVLRVIDDGVGFPKDLKPQRGLGYHIMNYRAQSMGGRLEVDSPQPGGTRLSCYSPLHAARSNKAPQWRSAVSSQSPKTFKSAPIS